MSKRCRKPAKSRWFIYVLYLLLATFLTTGVSMSRMTTTVRGTDVAAVAAPIVGGGFDIELADLTPGYHETWAFDVTNLDEDGRPNQVALRYYLQFSHSVNLPLQFSLYLTTSTGEAIPLAVDPETGRTQQEFELPIGTTEKRDKFLLEISWPGEEKDAAYAAELDYVTIKVVATQQDTGEEAAGGGGVIS